MIRQTLASLLVLVAAACTGEVSQNGAAGGDVSPALVVKTAAGAAQVDAVYRDPSMNTDERIGVIDSYILGIDGRLPTPSLPLGIRPLMKVPVPLAVGTFSDLTSEQWASMESYYDGPELRRLRMIAAAPAMATETFYYEGSKLVLVTFDPKGMVQNDPSPRAEQERYYFGREGLIAWVRPDNTKADPASDSFRRWSDQLLKESSRFPNGT